MKLGALSLLGALGLAGCSSTTYVVTDPPGAEVVLDETKSLGKSPVKINAQVMVWSEFEVKAIKEGYQTKSLTLRPDEPISPKYLALCLCSFGVLWPLTLLSDFEEPVYSLVLEPTKKTTPPDELVERPSIKFSSRN